MSDSATAFSRGRPVNEEARADRTAQILAGARRCFVEQGFHASSVGKISEAAGVSVANIYQYFPNKDALIEALIEEDIERELDLIRHIARTCLSVEVMRPILTSYFTTDVGRESAILTSEIVSEASRNPRVAKMQAAALGQAIAAIASTIEREQKAGRIDCRLPPSAAASMICLFFDSMVRRLVYQDDAGDVLLEELLAHFDFVFKPR